MSQPATLTWFARHEIYLLWRNWLSLMTAGKRRREPVLVIVAVVFAVLIHLLAYYLIAPVAKAGISPDKTTLVALTGSAFLSCSLMLSQAMESLTRAFYTWADLDLILSSPASARRVFAVRMMAIAISTMLLTTVIAAPFINAAVIYDGPRWLAAYGVLIAMGALSTAFAIAATVVLFRGLGPKRTRLISQIVSAVVGAGFVIGARAAAIISTGSIARLSFLRSEDFVARPPEVACVIWWPAHAIMGDMTALAVAPISGRAIIWAKIEAVLGAVAMVVAPLLGAVAFAAPKIAAVAALGVAISALSGTMIQIWFRAQAKRSNF